MIVFQIHNFCPREREWEGVALKSQICNLKLTYTILVSLEVALVSLKQWSVEINEQVRILVAGAKFYEC